MSRVYGISHSLKRVIAPLVVLVGVLFCCRVMAHADDTLADTVAAVKPAIVGVGTYQFTRSPQMKLYGTGFVVHRGQHVITNYHVVPRDLDTGNREQLSIFYRDGDSVKVRPVRVVREDQAHDLVLLQFGGEALPALNIGGSERVREGQVYAFTGFPTGDILGMIPATHTAVISALTPLAMPLNRAGQLDPKLIRRLDRPYTVFQLDATAYPGNSGSPMYDVHTGAVVAVLNMVFVKESRERTLDRPSGIAFAIPSIYIIDLLKNID